MSIVRVGLGETKDFAEGYDAIFGPKKKKEEATQTKSDTSAQPTSATKKESDKKK